MTTGRDEITAWLGPAARDLTLEQVDRLVREADDIAAYWPDPDDAAEREAALTAACQYLLGELDLAEAGRRRLASQAERDRALAAAVQVAAMVVADRVGQRIKGPTAEAAGIGRMLLLERLGERPRRRGQGGERPRRRGQGGER